jgi:uncharacterized protein YegL
MHRRLPVFFVVDVSESMAGDELYQLEEAMNTIITTLRKDPYALETAYVSVIVFAGKAKTLVPLVELLRFHQPELPIGGGTGLGSALKHLMAELDRTLIPSNSERKGDWRPVIFLLTDGVPTDDTRDAIDLWQRKYRDRVNLVAVSIGGQADLAVLRRLTDNVIVFMDAAPDAFARFAQWVSMSIQSASRSVATGHGDGVQIAKTDNQVVHLVEESGASGKWKVPDQRYAILIGKCERNQHPYLMKFERDPQSIRDFLASVGAPSEMAHDFDYIFKTVLPLHQNYYELSDGDGLGQTVNMTRLLGGSSCPHCGAGYTLALCGMCQNIHCIAGAGVAVCPWCKSTAEYGESDGSSDMIANRGQG